MISKTKIKICANRKIKKNVANIITGVQILGGILPAFAPVFSILFYALYLICGLSDMADGIVARKTDSESSFFCIPVISLRFRLTEKT